MDNRIAFIMPGHDLARTTRETIQDMGLEYPVFCAAEKQAFSCAEELEKKGTRIIVSSGSTYNELKTASSCLVMEMQYSASACAAALMEANALKGKPAVIGSRELCYWMERTMENMEEKIPVYPVSRNQTFEQITVELIQDGYDIIISGYPSVRIAREMGCTAIGITTDRAIVRLTLDYARYILRLMEEAEHKYETISAILNCVAEGIAVTDQNSIITFVNPAALRMIGALGETITGRSFDQVLDQYHLVDVLSEDASSVKEGMRKIVTNIVPIYFKGRANGYIRVIQDAERIQDMEHSIRRNLVQRGLVAKKRFSDIIGESASIQRTISIAEKYARYDSTVLIAGETGTGKELFAQSIHNASRRWEQAFVAVNCAALPETLLESELFGYAKGAFTGALREGRAGLFETAHGGTIFLDEISEISITMQARLLRVLQEKEIIRVGDNRVIPVDVRVLASSNRNLSDMVKQGKFREDLYYRLNILELNLPPLRERKEDIELIVSHMISKNNRKLGTHITGVTAPLLTELKHCPWPGNVRQLGNIIEQMMVICEGTVLDLPLPPSLQGGQEVLGQEQDALARGQEPLENGPRVRKTETGTNEFRTLAEMEQEMIQRTLDFTGGNKKETARLLGIDPSTLWRKMKQI